MIEKDTEVRQEMKGVVLAGGLGSRLYPLTYATNKHLLPVYDRPMVYYPIQTLVEAGISDVLVVAGGPHAGDFLNVLRNGDSFGVRKFLYAFQEKEGGIAQALALAEEFADGGDLAVILGDNTTDAKITKAVEKFKGGAHIFLKEVPDPQRFGVPRFTEFGENGKPDIAEIIEKPKDPPSNFAVTGLYLYDNTVFDKIRQVKPSGRGEMEITDVNNAYLKEGKLQWSELHGFWKDAGTFDTLLEVNNHWAKLRRKEKGGE